MGLYDQFIGLTQQGLDQGTQLAVQKSQMPTVADVFMDRFRQGGQDQLARQKAEEQARMHEATMKNMEAQRLIQGAQMMSLYGTPENQPVMAAVGEKIGIPQIPGFEGLKSRQLGQAEDQFSRKLESTEGIASGKNETAIEIAKMKPQKLSAIAQFARDVEEGKVPKERVAEGWQKVLYTTPPTPMSAPIPAVSNETGSPVYLQPKKEGGVVEVPGYTPVPRSGAGRKPVDPKKVNQILDEIEKVIPQTSGGAVGGALNWLKGQANISDPTTQANTKISAAGASLMMNMPRMEGPQSDKDVALYREQIGKLNDPRTPRGDKKAAVAIIRALNKQYASQNAETASTKGVSRVGQATKMADGQYSDGKTTVTVKGGKIVSEQ